jgi:hypothetical protein
VIAVAVLVVAGLGVAVASAATPEGNATAAAAASTSRTLVGSECANVFSPKAPAADLVGSLCTAVDSDGTAVSGVTVTFTAASSCSGSLLLRVSGADSAGVEFGDVQKVTCSSKKATASFTPVSKVATNTFFCGMLMAEIYTGAQACVPIS